MERIYSLDDFALFVAIADAGGLAGASRTTGISVPTLSRRMSELERRLGLHLFARGARGYRLTSSGRELLKEAEDLRSVAARLKGFAARSQRAEIRITAGQWTSQFLARHIKRVWSPEADWVPSFCASNLKVDIARREADIGIRNQRPEQNWLAGRRTCLIDYAVFARSIDVTGFVAVSEQAALTASARWVHQNHAEEIVITVSDAGLAVDLACQGVGQLVLPCFAAGAFPNLIRVSKPINELQQEEWIVSHHEARHDPPIRQALDAITQILVDRDLRETLPID